MNYKTGELDKGDEALKPHLQEGEVFITNGGTDELFEDSALSQAVALQLSGRWRSVRIISDIAFDVDGNLLPKTSAIVGVPIVEEAKKYASS